MGGVSFSDMLAALAFYAVLIVLVLAALVGLLAFIIWGATHPRLAGGDPTRTAHDAVAQAAAALPPISWRRTYLIMLLIVVVAVIPCAIFGGQAAWRVSRSPCGDEPQTLAALPELRLAPAGATAQNMPAGECSRTLHGASAVAGIRYVAPGTAIDIATFYAMTLQARGWISTNSAANSDTSGRYATTWSQGDNVLSLIFPRATPTTSATSTSYSITIYGPSHH